MAQAESLGAPWPGAVAVSGGGDSIALMLLLADWARQHGRPAPVVLTVDHGLRKDSAKDARRVVRAAKALELEAHVLTWEGVKPSSDIEAAAREARYQLMDSWCKEHRISGLYLAHTLDDQAETFLLRLARGSGVDGLSAMGIVAPIPLPGLQDVQIVRPLVEMRRESFRAYLRTRGMTWLEDPMNADPRFARAKLRAAWPMLTEIGLTPARIALAAKHLARARGALDREARVLLFQSCRFDGRAALVDPKSLAGAPQEIGLRALADVLMRVSGNPYRPRFERLERLYAHICASTLGRGMTLHGCLVAPAARKTTTFGPGALLVTPEKSRHARKTKGAAQGLAH